MPEISQKKKLILKRLTPLYITAFSHGFVFWYVVEKIFMRNIGFDDAGIGLMIAAYSVVMLATETPSGILADRWSRKGVLALASLFLAASALVGGISNSPFDYFIAAMLWGVFFALYSGTYDSIVYDTVLEESGSSHLFEEVYGRVKVVDSTALVVSSLIGGLIASFSNNLRLPYFFTIPFVLLGLFALYQFKEPRLHESKLATPIREHLKQTFSAILRNRSLLPIMAALVSTSTVMYILFEFSQLWYIALDAPIEAFGPANAAMLSSIGLGGLVVAKFRLARYRAMQGLLVAGVISSVALVYSRSLLVTIVFKVLLAIVLLAITVIFNRLLHDSLSSSVRAGASSAVSTLSRIIVVPLALIFGLISRNNSVFTAAWILVSLLVVAAIFIEIVARRKNKTGLAYVNDIEIANSEEIIR